VTSEASGAKRPGAKIKSASAALGLYQLKARRISYRYGQLEGGQPVSKGSWPAIVAQAAENRRRNRSYQ